MVARHSERSEAPKSALRAKGSGSGLFSLADVVRPLQRQRCPTGAVSRPRRRRIALLGFTGGVGMIKASESKDLAKTLVSGIKAWASGLKQWLKWVTGEAPVPDRRAKQILGGTAGAILLLVVGVSLLPGGSGNPPAARQSASSSHVAALTAQQAAERAALLRDHANETTTTPQQAADRATLLRDHANETTTTTTPAVTRRGNRSHSGHGGGARRLRASTAGHT
jgi:hypothetical protein